MKLKTDLVGTFFATSSRMLERAFFYCSISLEELIYPFITSSIFLSLGTWRIWGAWSGHFFIIWSFTDKCTPNSWGASWFEGISGSETQQFEMWTNFMQNCLKVMWLTLVVVSFEAVWKAGPVPSPLELVQLTSEVLSCENGRRFEA